MAVDIETLRRVRFLAPLKDRDLRKLAGSMSERTASAGEDLVTQGSGAIAFFVLLRIVIGTTATASSGSKSRNSRRRALANARSSPGTRAAISAQLDCTPSMNWVGFRRSTSSIRLARALLDGR